MSKRFAGRDSNRGNDYENDRNRGRQNDSDRNQYDSQRSTRDSQYNDRDKGREGGGKPRVNYGGMWEDKTRDGQTFFKIQLDTQTLADLMHAQNLEFGRDKVSLIAFFNDYRDEGEKRPDFKIFEPQTRKGGGNRSGSHRSGGQGRRNDYDSRR